MDYRIGRHDAVQKLSGRAEITTLSWHLPLECSVHDDGKMPFDSNDMDDFDRPATLRELRGELGTTAEGLRAELASKADLTGVVDVLRAELASKADLTGVVEMLRAELTSKAELRGTSDDLRAEIRSVKEELRTEMSSGFAELRGYIDFSVGSLRDELRRHFDLTAESFRSDFRNLYDWTFTVTTNLAARVEALEKRDLPG